MKISNYNLTLKKKHAKTMLIIGICLFIIAGAYFLYNVFYNNKTNIKTKELEIILKEKDELYRKIHNLQPYCGKISETNITDIFESNDERKQYIAYYSLSSEFQSHQQLMNFILQFITDEMLQKLKSKGLNTFDEKLYMEKDNILYCGHVFGGTRPIPDTIYRISKYDENTIVETATDIYGKENVDANIVDNNQYEYSITLLKENGLWKIDEYEFKSDNDNTNNSIKKESYTVNSPQEFIDTINNLDNSIQKLNNYEITYGNLKFIAFSTDDDIIGTYKYEFYYDNILLDTNRLKDNARYGTTKAYLFTGDNDAYILVSEISPVTVHSRYSIIVIDSNGKVLLSQIVISQKININNNEIN